MAALPCEWQPLNRSRSNTWPAHPRPLEDLNNENIVIGVDTTVSTSAPVPTPAPLPASAAPAPTSAPTPPRRSSRIKPWGDRSYAELIEQAISSAPDGRMTVAQIYAWLAENVPYFGERSESPSSVGWKNSVRHNLSLCHRFTRLHLNQSPGGGSTGWWTLDLSAPPGRTSRRRAGSMDVQHEAAARRRRSGKVRRAAAIPTAPLTAPIQEDEGFRPRASTIATPITRRVKLEDEDWHSHGSTLHSAVRHHHQLDPVIETVTYLPRPSSSTSSGWSSISSTCEEGRTSTSNSPQWPCRFSPAPALFHSTNRFRPRSSSTTSSCCSTQLSPVSGVVEDEPWLPVTGWGQEYAPAPHTSHLTHGYLPGTGGWEQSPTTLSAHIPPPQFPDEFMFRSRSASTSAVPSEVSRRLIPQVKAQAPRHHIYQHEQQASHSFWGTGAGYSPDPSQRSVQPGPGSLGELGDLRLDVRGSFGCDVGELVSSELTLEGCLDFESILPDPPTMPASQQWCSSSEFDWTR